MNWNGQTLQTLTCILLRNVDLEEAKSSSTLFKARAITIPEGHSVKAAKILFGLLEGFDGLIKNIHDFR